MEDGQAEEEERVIGSVERLLPNEPEAGEAFAARVSSLCFETEAESSPSFSSLPSASVDLTGEGVLLLRCL